jgi:hypothetical protein
MLKIYKKFSTYFLHTIIFQILLDSGHRFKCRFFQKKLSKTVNDLDRIVIGIEGGLYI